MIHGMQSVPPHLKMPPINPSITTTTYNHHPSLLLCFSSSPKSRRFFPPFKPLSSLKEPKKPTLPKPTSNVPQSFRFEDPNKGSGRGGGGSEKDGLLEGGSPSEDAEDGLDGGNALKGTLLAGLLLVGVVGGFGAVGYVYRDQVNAFLTQFSGFIEGYGPAGYALFVAVYAGLEVLAIPAIPLTMSAGLLFGSFVGTIIVSISGTRIMCAMMCSWLGMLPGTWAYVSAGAFGRAIIQEESEMGLPGGNGQLLTLGLGLLATALAAAYVTRLAKDAVKDIE
ncbi:hypothetical protein QJS10_CPB19g00251 [Acorus calamus]|uniref:Uncharacterized protein n=1 Tax=Acorus calamus TaxID=4465 RepID=A0AAV9CGV7_ACOCL|nr:hypothetical protein QJS10_CPB19g00251 [Acorus calamus]